MAVDLYSITPRKVEEARGEVARLEARWREYRFADIDLESLAQQEEAVHRLAGELQQRRRECDELTKHLRQRRQARKWLSLSLQLWEVSRYPSRMVLLGVAVLVTTSVLSLFVGALTTAAFGLLLGFIITCMATLVGVLWYYASHEWGDEWATDINARLHQARHDSEGLSAGVESARKLVRDARTRWERARADHRRMVGVYQLARSCEEAKQEYDRLLGLVQSRKYQLLHCNWSLANLRL